jgi:hypothetical protein
MEESKFKKLMREAEFPEVVINALWEDIGNEITKESDEDIEGFIERERIKLKPLLDNHKKLEKMQDALTEIKTKEDFAEILRAEGYPEKIIDILWNTRDLTTKPLTTESIRATARAMKHLYVTDPKLN